MQKNQIFTGTIDGCTSQGFGVARLEDRAVFVKGAIPGETCEIPEFATCKTRNPRRCKGLGSLFA